VTNQNVPAGWYEDPYQPNYLRWWDGTNWTEHLSLKQMATPETQLAETPVQYNPSGVPITYSGQKRSYSKEVQFTQSSNRTNSRAIDFTFKSNFYAYLCLISSLIYLWIDINSNIIIIGIVPIIMAARSFSKNEPFRYVALLSAVVVLITTFVMF
jgi:hypothetical protein